MTQLAQLHADVEGDHVDQQAVGRQLQGLQLGGQAKAVDQTKAQDGKASVRLDAEHRLEAAEIVEGLVGHRQADHRIDQERIDVDLAQHAGQQRDAVADAEQGDVEGDILQPVEEEDHA